jgi:hypothetical protein
MAQPRVMTFAECAALRDVEAAEQAMRDAAARLEDAHERLAATTRRERRRERLKAGVDRHLELIAGAR